VSGCLIRFQRCNVVVQSGVCWLQEADVQFYTLT
jgi:hypothetical protein